MAGAPAAAAAAGEAVVVDPAAVLEENGSDIMALLAARSRSEIGFFILINAFSEKINIYSAEPLPPSAPLPSSSSPPLSPWRPRPTSSWRLT